MFGYAIYLAISDKAEFESSYVNVSSLVYVKEIVPNAYNCSEIKSCECIESLYTPCNENIKNMIAGECSGESKWCNYKTNNIIVDGDLITEQYCDKRVKHELCNTIVGTCGNPTITIGYEYNKTNYEYIIKHKCTSVSDFMDNFIELYENNFSMILYVNTSNPNVIYTSEPKFRRMFQDNYTTILLLCVFGFAAFILICFLMQCLLENMFYER